MSRVMFKFQNGKQRVMPTVLADVLTRRGLGSYLTRDMIATREVPVKAEPVEVETDSAGDEWNPDLHVATKLKNQNGTWRKKPGAAAAQESAE